MAASGVLFLVVGALCRAHEESGVALLAQNAINPHTAMPKTMTTRMAANAHWNLRLETVSNIVTRHALYGGARVPYASFAGKVPSVGPTLNIHFRNRRPAPQLQYKTSKPQGIYLSSS